MAFENSSVIGILSGGAVHLNPAAELVYAAGTS